MQDILVVGATGVAGTAAMLAARDVYGSDVRITGVWFGHGPASPSSMGWDRELEADVSDPAFLDRLRGRAGEVFDCLFFATAVGEVGFPVEDASREQIEEACRVSFDPMLRMEKELRIGRIVGYSTFYNLPHQRLNYGAMGATKEKLEEWVAGAETKGRRSCIRAGAFPSASSRAIKLMLRRRAKQLADSADPRLRELFANRKSSEAVDELERIVQDEERTTFGDTGTTAEDLREAHRALLRNPSAPFVNVCGKRIWISDTPQRL